MSVSSHKQCPKLELLVKKQGDPEWQEVQYNLEHQSIVSADDINDLVSADCQILMIIAKADEINTCPTCRGYLSETFEIPETWWRWFCKDLNGYFGAEEIMDQAGKTTGYNTWAYFETKFYYGDTNTYSWLKLNLFSRWIPSTETTILIALDPPAQIKEKLRSPMIKNSTRGGFGDPFWIYEGLLEIILDLQDQSVWMIRDQVRAIEKSRALVTQPNPDYGHLHELSRHAIHVSETLEVTVKTVESILQQHSEFVMGNAAADKMRGRASKRLRDRLLFLEQVFVALKHRSASNQARLQNEIQLSFNTVAQYDARTSVEIGRAAQQDSAAMKTVAFLTLTFLPATFISAIFSTSFFNFDGEQGVWAVSDKIWIFWVVSIPITSFTVLLWFFWHRVFPPTLVGHGGVRSTESCV